MATVLARSRESKAANSLLSAILARICSCRVCIEPRLEEFKSDARPRENALVQFTQDGAAIMSFPQMPKYFLVFAFYLAVTVVVPFNGNASSRGSSCRITQAPVPPGNYSIIVAGSDEKHIAAAIRRVVSEEHQARPAFFADTKIEVFDSGARPPEGQRAIATIIVGSADSKPSVGDDHLNIIVPKIYETNDPQYVRVVKLDTAGIHLAFRSLLFFSGEAKATDDTMSSAHFGSLPDEFVYDSHDKSH